MLSQLMVLTVVVAQAAPKQIPPEVSNPYMVAGYTVVFLILLGMIAFLVNRSRRLRQDWALLIEMDKDKQPPAAR